MTPSPSLTFFCELEPEPLAHLFTRPGLIEQLQRLNAAVSLGLMDESPERAALVRQLNHAGVPVTAWLLLRKDQGYWFNLDNASLAAQRYADFQSWSNSHGLQWAAVGLDIEMDIRAMQALAANRLRGLRLFLKTLKNSQGYHYAVDMYRQLVSRIRADGHCVESYQFPMILDEREVKSQLVQRLAGVIDLPVDREVIMLYSSFFPHTGAGLLAEYGPLAGGIGLGSTGGGVTMEGLVSGAPLGWQDLSRDLRMAYQTGRPVYIFSLEGCLEQGFLDWLEDFNWQAPAFCPENQLRQVKRYRLLLRGLLRLSRIFLR